MTTGNKKHAMKTKNQAPWKGLALIIMATVSLSAGCQSAETTPESPKPISTPTHTPTPIMLPGELESMEIAFISDRDGNEEIYTMGADGSDQRNISNHHASDSDPKWSPDGKTIVFAAKKAAKR